MTFCRIVRHSSRTGFWNAIPTVAARPLDPLAVQPDLALVGDHQPGDQPRQRGLAAARRADDGDEAALGHRQLQPVQHRKRPGGGAVGVPHALDVDEVSPWRLGPADGGVSPAERPRHLRSANAALGQVGVGEVERRIGRRSGTRRSSRSASARCPSAPASIPPMPFALTQSVTTLCVDRQLQPALLQLGIGGRVALDQRSGWRRRDRRRHPPSPWPRPRGSP